MGIGVGERPCYHDNVSCTWMGLRSTCQLDVMVVGGAFDRGSSQTLFLIGH